MQTIPHKGRVSFRPIHDNDHDFLLGLYTSTREWERQAVTWTDVAWQEFVAAQFKLQDQSYRMNFLGASFSVIEMDGVAIGRLYAHRQDACLRIIEFTIAPAWRGRGIGTDILRALMNEAHGGKVPVRLSVEANNPALALYQRHGFKVVEDTGRRLEMKWMPATGPREI
jgi:RimJ/RimL family protein N-acetyltransferase